MEYWLGVATLVGIYMIAVLGVSILCGFTGMFSMGHAGFMAVSYTHLDVYKRQVVLHGGEEGFRLAVLIAEYLHRPCNGVIVIGDQLVL